MLETRKAPHSPRIQRLDDPLRATARVSRAAVQPQPRSIGNVALGQAQTVPRRAERPASLPRQNRLGRSEMRLMGIATTCTAVVCGMLLLYLAAYAHVSRLGIDQASALVQLRQSRLQNEMLRAERDRLQSPERVAAAAATLGMLPRGSTPIQYIAAPFQAEPLNVAEAAIGGRNKNDGRDGGQGTNGGTTADSSAAASFGH